jgi:hypothetical protein
MAMEHQGPVTHRPAVHLENASHVLAGLQVEGEIFVGAVGSLTNRA